MREDSFANSHSATLYQYLPQLVSEVLLKHRKLFGCISHGKKFASPFKDNLIGDISSRFSTRSKQESPLQGLLSVNISVNTSIVDLNEAIASNSYDLFQTTSLMKTLSLEDLRLAGIKIAKSN